MIRPVRTSTDTRRTRAMARSFYEQLSREGFTPDQVVGLATTLLDLVHAELHAPPPAPAAK